MLKACCAYGSASSGRFCLISISARFAYGQHPTVSSFGCRLDHGSEPAERVAFSDKLNSLRGINQTPKRGEGMKAVRFQQLGGPDVLKLKEVQRPDLHDAEALVKSGLRA
jgi:hypothetical protein